MCTGVCVSVSVYMCVCVCVRVCACSLYIVDEVTHPLSASIQACHQVNAVNTHTHTVAGILVLSMQVHQSASDATSIQDINRQMDNGMAVPSQ